MNSWKYNMTILAQIASRMPDRSLEIHILPLSSLRTD